MALSLELHRYRIILYARNEHIVSEVRHVLHHRYKYQLEAIVLLFQDLQVLRYCLDRCNVGNTSNYQLIAALYLFHDDPFYQSQDQQHLPTRQC